MPAIFLGYGNPMNAVQNNYYTYAWGTDRQEPYDWALRFEQKARG